MITLTEEQFKEMIEAAHRAGQHNQGHCDPSVYEAMVYYEREVKKIIIPDVVGQREQLVCPCCGSDKTYKTDAIHCNRCAVTTEI